MLKTRPPRQVSSLIILPLIWSANDFPISITKEVYKRLRLCFQIADDIPIRKVDKGEKCYIGRSPEVGFYKAAFIAGFRLSLSLLHCRLADVLGILVCQLAPNT